MEHIKKRKILINTDNPLICSGLGRNGKELALYLHKTGRWDVIYYCCGMTYDHPDYQRYPFKVVGTLPNNLQEMEQINKDQGYARACAYGLYYIDRVIKEFKPEIALFVNDSWAINWTEHAFWNKIHCVPHITLDSIPFLPDQIQLIKKSKDFFVWTDFAEREANRLGFQNVRTIPGIIDSKKFFKLPKYKKQELRKRFNIPENAFICSYVARNQIRKEFKSLLEGYSIFKKQNPEIKNSYLLLHTHFSEPQGWDLPRFINELGINNEEILTTYICKACKNIEVKPFKGQNIDCKYCNSKQSQETCNVGLGCTVEELNEIYNLSDCYCHPANCGGFEIPLTEAIYTELVTSTVNYSFGETFVAQDFVFPIEFAWSVQLGTQFKRAVPYPQSIAKFLKKVYDMLPEKRAELGKRAREWAISKFSPEVVCKQWENYLDSLPPIDWDYNFEVQAKNPQAVIPPIEDNAQWIITLYKEILNMTVDKNDSGFIHWETSLKNGAKREDIENFFRNVAMQENGKNQKPVDFSTQLINNDKKHFLIILKESIGDLIYSTALLQSFRRNYPKEEWNIYFATSSEYKNIFDGNTYIDKVLDYQPFMESELLCTGQGNHKGFFNGYCHLGNSLQHKLNYLTNTEICLPHCTN